MRRQERTGIIVGAVSGECKGIAAGGAVAPHTQGRVSLSRDCSVYVGCERSGTRIFDDSVGGKAPGSDSLVGALRGSGNKYPLTLETLEQATEDLLLHFSTVSANSKCCSVLTERLPLPKEKY